MTTRLVYQDINHVVELLGSDYIISLQSEYMGDHACYVATNKKTDKSITISEKVILLIEDEKDHIKSLSEHCLS